MFELKAHSRWAELSEARDQLSRRLDMYQQQYRAKEAQYAELGVVRRRNLQKVLNTLERQEKISKSRTETMNKDYMQFQSASRMIVQSSLDGTSHAQRSLGKLQQQYYNKMQAMMPSWEEHKTKLKLKKLSELQEQKLKLEEQRIRVAELSKYNNELDERLHQFADQVSTLERQVMDESSGQMEKQRQARVREQNDRDRR
jgi:DNA repair exonuclease SbcCD ATPase subunit